MSGSSMTKFVRRISFVAALLLSLSLSMPAQAVQPPVVNPSFGTAPTCTTSGWTTVGDVTALTEAQAGLSASSNCVARVHSVVNRSNFAMLKQTLNPPTVSTRLVFTTWYYSDNGTDQTGVQIITLRTSNGNIFYTQWRNISSTTPMTFSYFLGEGENQITLELSTYINGEDINSPTSNTLAKIVARQITTFGLMN